MGYREDVIKAALEYGRDFLVVPTRAGTKQPAERWKPWLGRRQHEADIRRRFEADGEVGVAVVPATGKALVLDLDGDARALLPGHELPPTPTVATARGHHLYFAHPGGRVSSSTIAPGIDVRSMNIVLAPPTFHPSGVAYAWAPFMSLEDLPLAPCPAWLLDLLAHPSSPVARTGKSAGKQGEWVRSAVSGALVGARHATLLSIAGHLAALGVDAEVAEDLVVAWNLVMTETPLPLDEVRDVLAWVEKQRSGRRRREVLLRGDPDWCESAARSLCEHRVHPQVALALLIARARAVGLPGDDAAVKRLYGAVALDVQRQREA